MNEREGIHTRKKINVNEKSILARAPPASACSTPAIIKELKVQVKSKKVRIRRNMRKPRSWTVSVGSAFL